MPQLWVDRPDAELIEFAKRTYNKTSGRCFSTEDLKPYEGHNRIFYNGGLSSGLHFYKDLFCTSHLFSLLSCL